MNKIDDDYVKCGMVGHENGFTLEEIFNCKPEKPLKCKGCPFGYDKMDDKKQVEDAKRYEEKLFPVQKEK